MITGISDFSAYMDYSFFEDSPSGYSPLGCHSLLYIGFFHAANGGSNATSTALVICKVYISCNTHSGIGLFNISLYSSRPLLLVYCCLDSVAFGAVIPTLFCVQLCYEY